MKEKNSVWAKTFVHSQTVIQNKKSIDKTCPTFKNPEKIVSPESFFKKLLKGRLAERWRNSGMRTSSEHWIHLAFGLSLK